MSIATFRAIRAITGSVTLFVVFALGCATGRDQTPPTVADAPVPSALQGTAEAGAESPAVESAPEQIALRQALNAARVDPAQRETLHLAVACHGDYGTRSVEVHGSGVGIWDTRKQFELGSEQLASLLDALAEADFLGFAEVYGGSKKPDPQPKEEPTEAIGQTGQGHALRVICRVELSLAGETKQSVQVGKGEQSAQLKKLANDLLDICQKPGEAGTAAADLTDGLEKVARGELAPEAFRLLLHRKSEDSSSEAGGGGFLLRLSGTHATSRGYDPETGLAKPRSLSLTPAEVADLARRLADLNLPRFPVNLFALDYTDLAVEVLDHKKSVQARQFAGMTATTHAGFQPDFERTCDALEQLHLRVMTEGEPNRAAPQVGGQD